MSAAFKAWPVLLVAGGLGFLVAKGFILPYVIEEEYKESFVASGPAPAVVVDVYNGSIKITRGKDREIHARLVKRAEGSDKPEAEKVLETIQVRMEKQEGNRFSFVGKRVDPHSPGNSGVYAELQVPADADIRLVTKNGSVSVNDIQGPMQITTQNGSVSVRGNQKPVVARTSNACISIVDGRGKLDLTTSNGSVNVQAQQADLQVKTSNSSVSFLGTLETGGTHNITTSNGSIRVTLPPDAQFHMKADTSNGRVSNDFVNEGSSRKRKRSAHQEVSVGSQPRFSLKLQTSNSSIYLKKSSSADDDSDD